ncbi:MAG: Minf_1886 family protein, partial [Planctomycetota bacterium]
MEEQEPKSLKQIAEGTKYPVDAFHFLRRGLDHTVHGVHQNPEQMSEQERHVSGQQLSEGLRDFAIQQYGPLARTVLRRWNINRTEDFGHIVFAMVEGGLMQATEEDSVTDFDSIYDLDDALRVQISLENVPRGGFEYDP